MSEWDEYFEAGVLRILGLPEFDTRTPHHFEHPFVSAYQLAVAFERDNHDLCQRFNKVIGEGEGMENLSAYIAHQLSAKIRIAKEKKPPENYPVEAIWLSGTGVPALLYRHNKDTKRGVPNTKYNGYSLYRLKQVNSK